MKAYKDRSKEELLTLKNELEAEYKKFQEMGLKLDMSRGKPSAEQLDISMGMMDVLNSSTDLKCREGIDCRNYGVIDGIQEAKELLADLIEVPADKIIIYGDINLVFNEAGYEQAQQLHELTSKIILAFEKRSQYSNYDDKSKEKDDQADKIIDNPFL